MAIEMGKPLSQGRAELEKCALTCDDDADNAERFLRSELVESDAQRSYVAYRPLGVVLAVIDHLNEISVARHHVTVPPVLICRGSVLLPR